MLRIPNTFQMEICLPRRHRISCDFASIELPEHKSTHGYITWVDQICKKRKKENTASCWRVRRFVHVGECGEREKKIAKKNRPIQRGAINRDTEKKSHMCVCGTDASTLIELRLNGIIANIHFHCHTAKHIERMRLVCAAHRHAHTKIHKQYFDKSDLRRKIWSKSDCLAFVWLLLASNQTHEHKSQITCA